MGIHDLLAFEGLKPVVGFDGYFVSPSGRVFSNRPKNGKGGQAGPLRELKPLKCSKGRYYQFSAMGKKILIHRAVAEAFMGPCPAGKEVSHIDGNSHNNCLTNLEYVSHKDNESMKILHGTSAAGEKNGSAKLTTSNVNEIRIRFKREGRGSGTRLAKEFGVCESTISNIVHGKRWPKKHGGGWEVEEF